MFTLFDAHCHLAPESDTEQRTTNSTPVAVSGRLLCSVEPGEFDRVRNAAAAWAGTHAAFGVHPWHVRATLDAFPDWRDRLSEAVRNTPASWIGEIGLDGLKTDLAPSQMQDDMFSEQLRLARELTRPVNLHCVKAWEPLVALLDREYLPDGPRPFIIHSFAGPHQFVDALHRRGAYFTLGPLAAQRDGRRQRARVALIPTEKVLLESDAFLRPGADEGGDLLQTLRWLAEVRETDVESMAYQITENERRLFSHG